MSDRVARSPARLRSRDGNLRGYRRHEYDFLAFCLVALSGTRYFLFLYFVPLRPYSGTAVVSFTSSCCFVGAAVIRSC